MSTLTVVTIAFRCTKCWQMTAAQSDQAGTEIPCLCCATPVFVPETTPERVAAGEEFLATTEVAAPPTVSLSTEVSDQEIYAQVEQETRENAHHSHFVSSRLKRFFGAMIDSTAVMIACGIGFAMGAVISPESPFAFLAISLLPPLMLGLCQMQMIAADGRTIGKYCLKMKIVNQKGDPPGFLQGILLRSLLVGLLGIIPLFALVNILWIFGNAEHRCLHDYIGGTHVIDA